MGEQVGWGRDQWVIVRVDGPTDIQLADGIGEFHQVVLRQTQQPDGLSQITIEQFIRYVVYIVVSDSQLDQLHLTETNRNLIQEILLDI